MLNIKKELLTVFKKDKSGGGQKGVSVYLALMIMILVLAISLGISTIVVNQMKMIRGMGDSVVAICAADTGIERVLFEDKLCRQSSCAVLGFCVNPAGCDAGRNRCLESDPCVISGNVDSSRYEAYFDNGTPQIIQSTGIYKGARRTIEVKRQ